MCEDMHVAARMLLKGWNVTYEPDAKVFHSHDYSLSGYFQRSFDVGVFHAREPRIREYFGAPEGEGLLYVRSHVAYLLRNAPLLIPKALFHDFFGYAG